MKKYFLIGAIGFLGACAKSHDVSKIQELSSEENLPAIVNGKIVNLKSDLHSKTIVSLTMNHGGGKGANCTGTVIGQKVILTAGHCLEGAKEVKVRFAAAPDSAAPVAEWKIHPKYRKPENSIVGEITPDLAIIRLKNAIPKNVKIARMATTENKLRLEQTVLSYGYGFSEAGTYDFLGIFEWDYKDNNRMLNAGSFAIVAAKDAGTKFKVSKLGLDGGVFLTYKTQSSICQGDSGGPTFLTKTEVPTIVGVNSFITSGNCIEAVNGIADLRHTRSWVDQTIAKWFPAPAAPAPQAPPQPAPARPTAPH